MLTKLQNGNAIDLSKATSICASEGANSWHVISENHVQYGKCDTFEQACQERDRLIEIANRQSSKTVVVKNNRFRASDVISVSIVKSYESPFTDRLAYVNVRKVDGSGTVPHGTLFETPEKAHEYAREIMEQVAGSQE